MLKKILRARIVLRSVGWILAGYLKLVQKTNRFVVEPANVESAIYSQKPAIIAMWHGQHFMTPFIKRAEDDAAVIISRHGDGEINAAAVEAWGFRTVRGSGAQRRDQMRKRGGAQALRAALQMLKDNVSLAMTADVPKVSRVAGKGIVTLAQMSGRPIIALAVVNSRRIDFRNWDRTSIGLPFGRCAIVFGTSIHVSRDASAQELEAARLAVEASLDDVHRRAFELVGAADPGAGRESVRLARLKAQMQELAPGQPDSGGAL